MTTETSDTPSPAKSSKRDLVMKRCKPTSSIRLVDKFVDEGIPENEPTFDDEEADMQRAVEESLKDVYDAHWGPLPPVVFREPDSGRRQPLPETPKKKSSVEQYIFQRCTPAPTKPSGHAESPSLYAELGLTDSETESDEEVLPVIKIGVQNEGQAGPNPGIQDEGQAGSNPGDVVVSQPQSSHAGPNREHMDFEENLKLTVKEQVILEEPARSTGTLSSLKHLAKDFSFGDQFFNDKPSEAKNEKTTIETKVESMVSITIQQDSSAIPPMITPEIDIISRPDSPNVHRPLLATTTAIATTTTTTILPPPPQPQQSTIDSLLMKCISELEQIMATLIHDKSQLEERLDKHGSRLYKLENIDIPHQVSKIQAPLRDRFRDFPKDDMKEILHHRMWESNSYKAHEDHKKLYEALEKSMDRD
ncbi:hypothetical protein Tco_0514731 [Tanacetum coccineum]